MPFSSDGLPWFPQGYADAFYVAKGALALLATIALIVHMARAWDTITGWGPRLRYLTLFYFAVLLVGASVGQSSQHETVNWWNIGGIIGAALLVVAMGVSLAETWRRHR